MQPLHLLLVVFVATVCLAPPALATDQSLSIYDDQLQNGFADWSWATHDLAYTAVVHSGTHAISMWARNWEGLYFHRNTLIDVSALDTLECWVHGGTTSGKQILAAFYLGGQSRASGLLGPFVEGGFIPAGTWARAVIPLAALGLTSGTIDGIIFQSWAPGDQGTLYFDDLVLHGTSAPPAPVTVDVDPDADRRPIQPEIYGVNFGSSQEFASLPYPLRRWGGNATTRYSFLYDTANRSSDWFFMNVPEDNDAPELLPDGSAADRFVEETLGANAEVILTVPTIGWTPLDRSKRWGFSIAEYGPQQLNECEATGYPPWCQPDAGNGVRPNGTWITGNDPLDTSVPIGPGFVTAWMAHIANRVGPAGAGGVRLFTLDNEPMLWNSTHRDVHPGAVTYDELWQRMVEYSSAVKSQDPDALVLGPSCWGWCDYFNSAADGCSSGPDRQAHGGLPLLEWVLQRVHDHEEDTGVRLIDYLDIHYYPQASGVALSDDESPATSALRLRSVKSLYDPLYVDESWIGQAVMLIPRMKAWIASRCPGLKLAITEYNFGGDSGLSSALAQAEVLAVFGREGVDLATRWVAPAAGSRGLDAFRLYLDFDGQGSRLDGESVRATSSDVDRLGAYAIRGSGTTLSILLVNKSFESVETEVSVNGGLEGPVQLYRFDESMPLSSVGQIASTPAGFAITLPPRSVTLARAQSAAASAGEPPVRHIDDWGIAKFSGVTPQPSRSSVFVGYELRAPSETRIAIVDIAGRQVRELLPRRQQEAGSYSVRWDGADEGGGVTGSGVYFVKLEADRRIFCQKLVRVQ